MKGKKSQNEIILAGSGGQGLVSLGIMLGEAAILEDKNVMQATSYGIAQRGGLSMAEVIISDNEILFQHVQRPDSILALTDDSINLYLPLAKEGVSIFYDTTLMQECKGDNLYGHPFTKLANEIGHPAVANVIALGAMIAKNRMIDVKSMAEVLLAHFKEKTADMNIVALNKGYSLGSN